MASILKIGNRWRAQVRRRGHTVQTQTFATKVLAEKWARQIEADMDAGRATGRITSAVTVADLVDRYEREVGTAKPFGRNKAAVLKVIRSTLGHERAGDW